MVRIATGHSSWGDARLWTARDPMRWPSAANESQVCLPIQHELVSWNRIVPAVPTTSDRNPNAQRNAHPVRSRHVALQRMAVQDICFAVGKHQSWPAIRHRTSERHHGIAPGDHQIDGGAADVDLLFRPSRLQARAPRKNCRQKFVSQGCPSIPVLWPLCRMIHANHTELASPSAFHLAYRNRLLDLPAPASQVQST